jgi:two-component system, cell cycle sensor histidine kinase and response regulator CckA
MREEPVRSAAMPMFEKPSTSTHLREARPRRLAAIEESPAAVAAKAADLMCTHDLEGRILSVSPAVCEVFGVSQAALRGTSIRDLLTTGATSDLEAYLHAVMTDSFAVGSIRVRTSAGGRRVWKYHATLETADRETPVIRATARDVTDVETAFRAVRNSEEHFRSIIENASDVIAIIELDGRIRYESPSVERVLGYRPDVLIGRPFLDLIHPDDARAAEHLLARQIADPTATSRIELRARHHRGSWQSFEIVANTLVKRGKPSAVLVNARDITERKLLEAQLVQANRLAGLGRLAATVAHEFNNVLMGMQPFAELMQRPEATPLMISKGAGHIATSIQRGKRIVMDILRFTQPHVPATTTVDLAGWWETFGPEATAVLGNMISVVTSIPSGLCITADRGQLYQVLANLVANSRDAMPAGGKLIVEANELAQDATFTFGVVPQPERFVQISITDTGCGMTPDVMERAFEPLYTTRETGGTGLGLAVAHQVITRHGGYIFVESEPGAGTTFHLFLAKAATPPPLDTESEKPGPAPAARKLLIIEDEQTIVDGLSALLDGDGIDVEAIGSGLQAAEAVARFHPDVILLDYGLPGMDGSEVYALIRTLDPTVAIIFATGHGDRRTLYDSLEDSRTRFLQKPFEVSELLALMVELETGGAP